MTSVFDWPLDRQADLRDLARLHGTPLFIYRVEVLRQRVARLRRHFDGVSLLYAMKANPHPELLRALHGEVDGLDISSEGELAQAISLGYPAEVLSFTGPAKSRQALDLAVQRGVGAICVESVDELAELAQIARRVGRSARVRLRINPPEPVKAFRVVVGGRASPFGIELDEIGAAAEMLTSNTDVLAYVGPHFHVGSQCTSSRALALHVAQCLQLSREMEQRTGLPAESVNLGGGFGVLPPGGGKTLDLGDLAARVTELLATHARRLGRAPRFCFELGRYLVAPAGVFVATVRRVKRSRGRLFAILDGGINCMLAASGMWSEGARQHDIVNLDGAERPAAIVQLVGPLCTPADVLGCDVRLALPRPGDRMAFLNAGAYGPTASLSEFIGHARVKELVLSAGVALLPGQPDSLTGG